jgi:hypothetical protein
MREEDSHENDWRELFQGEEKISVKALRWGELCLQNTK